MGNAPSSQRSSRSSTPAPVTRAEPPRQPPRAVSPTPPHRAGSFRVERGASVPPALTTAPPSIPEVSERRQQQQPAAASPAPTQPAVPAPAPVQEQVPQPSESREQDIGQSIPGELRPDVVPRSIEKRDSNSSSNDSASGASGGKRAWTSAATAVEQTIERMKERALLIAQETAERRAHAREEDERLEAAWKARGGVYEAATKESEAPAEHTAGESVPAAVSADPAPVLSETIPGVVEPAVIPFEQPITWSEPAAHEDQDSSRIAFPRSDTAETRYLPGAFLDGQTDAAAKIQRAWRRHKSRPMKPVPIEFPTQDDLSAAATKIQRFWRLHRLPVPKAIASPAEDDRTALLESSAAKIQRFWRRAHARKVKDAEGRAALEAYVNTGDRESEHSDSDSESSVTDSSSGHEHELPSSPRQSFPLPDQLEREDVPLKAPIASYARRRLSEAEDPGYGTQESEDFDSDAGPKPERPMANLRKISESSEWLLDRADESVNGEVAVEPPTPGSLLVPSSPDDDVPARARTLLPRAVRVKSPPALERWPSRSMAPHTFEAGIYTLTDDRFGAALDLHGGNNADAIAFPCHNGENQQWEFVNLGYGFAIKSVRTQEYLSMHLGFLSSGAPAPVRTSKYPVCWEIEAQRLVDTNGDDEDEDILIRVRWPETDFVLCLDDGTPGTKVCLAKGTGASAIWRTALHPRPQVTLSPPMTTENTMTRVDDDRRRGRTTVTTTTTFTTTTTKTIARISTTDH